MFENNFLATGCAVDNETAARLIVMRDRYDYPRAYMRYSSVQTEFQLTLDVWAEPVHPAPGEITDLQLDSHHSNLLNSANPLDNLLGTLSTVFWGFYTFSPGFALVRAGRHLAGYGDRNASTSESVAQALKAMAAAEDMGVALGSLAPLSQLGRVPFGSKVVAFKRALVAGVLDNQLDRGLRRSRWAQGAPFLRAIGGVHEVRYQERYAAWCKFLCVVAESLNVGIRAGNPWHWQASESRSQEWRAIDVERAIFKFFQMESNNPEHLAQLLEHAPLCA
jgi:hypothetical protein